MEYHLTTTTSLTRIVTDKKDNIIIFETIKGNTYPESFKNKVLKMQFNDFKNEIKRLYKAKSISYNFLIVKDGKYETLKGQKHVPPKPLFIDYVDLLHRPKDLV